MAVRWAVKIVLAAFIVCAAVVLLILSRYGGAKALRSMAVASTPVVQRPATRLAAQEESRSSSSTKAAAGEEPLRTGLLQQLNRPISFASDPDGKQRAYEELLAKHKAQCGKVPLSAGRTSNEGLRIVSFGGRVGVWSRFWIVSGVALTASRATPQCIGGDVLEISMESNDAKVAVDRIFDLGNGIHEVQVFVRRPGSYQLCVDVVMSFGVELLSSATLAQTENNKSLYTYFPLNARTVGSLMEISDDYFKSGNQSGAQFCVKRKRNGEPLWRMCGDGAATAEGTWTGAPVTPPIPSIPCHRPRLRRINSPTGDAASTKVIASRAVSVDMFRAGHWVRLPDGVCDGVHCSGNLSALHSDGWVWASDMCTVHIFPTDSKDDIMAQVFDGQWLLGFGTSTLKQPMANMMEYMLHEPIFDGFMEDIPVYQAKFPTAKKPMFFEYRMWDKRFTSSGAGGANKKKSTRVSMLWAGCPKITRGPHECYATMGLNNRKKLRKYLGGPMEFPSAIIMDPVIWRYPLWNERKYFEQISNAMNTLIIPRARNASDRVMAQAPIIWHTATHPLHSGSERSCGAPPGVHLSRHLTWALEDFLAENWRNEVMIISRFHLTAPLHFGDVYAHFGVHYGSSKGMCYTGVTHKDRYALKNCLRKTLADDMLVQLWFNILSVGKGL